jgi:hypothetical protein
MMFGEGVGAGLDVNVDGKSAGGGGALLDVWTTHSVTPVAFNLYGDTFKRHCTVLPGKYRLPFRVDMTVRLDGLAMFLFVGGGHVSFGTPWQNNRKIEDIAVPSGKPNLDRASYDNHLPFGEFVDIAVTYDMREMQIMIGGEERFWTRKLPYMKSAYADGFEIGLVVTKLSTLTIKSVTVTEYDGNAPITRGGFVEIKREKPPGERPKHTFDSVASGLPADIRDELIVTDSFLTALRPLRFKRAVDKNGGKISYVASGFGVSYAFNASGAESSQNFGWYIVHNGKPETWHIKNDCMEEALASLAVSDARLAGRIFYALNDCVGCYGPRCLAKRPYELNGIKRLACHGRVVMRANHEDFAAARGFFAFLNDMIKTKNTNDLRVENVNK